MRRVSKCRTAGNVGGSQCERMLPEIDRHVMHAFYPTPSPRKPEPKSRAPRSRLKFTDEEVLLIRTKAEYEGYTCRDLAEAFDVDYQYMYRLLTYQVRSKLVPKRPEGV